MLLESTRNVAANVKARYPIQFLTQQQAFPMVNGFTPFIVFRNIGNENGIINQQNRNIKAFLKAVAGLDSDDTSLVIYEACHTSRLTIKDRITGKNVPQMVSLIIYNPDGSQRDVTKQKSIRESEIVMLCFPGTRECVKKIQTILQTLHLPDTNSASCIKCKSFPLELIRYLSSSINERTNFMKNNYHALKSVSGAIIKNIKPSCSPQVIFNAIIHSINNLSTIAAIFRVNRDSKLNETWAVINTVGPLSETHFDITILSSITSSICIEPQSRFSSLTRASQSYANNPSEVATDVTDLSVDGIVSTYFQNTQKQHKAKTNLTSNSSSSPVTVAWTKSNNRIMNSPSPKAVVKALGTMQNHTPSVSTITTVSSRSDNHMEQRLDAMNNNMQNMFNLMQSQLAQMQKQQSPISNGSNYSGFSSMQDLSHGMGHSQVYHQQGQQQQFYQQQQEQQYQAMHYQQQQYINQQQQHYQPILPPAPPGPMTCQDSVTLPSVDDDV
jgi:hypothetical protein